MFAYTPDNCFISFLINHKLHNAHNKEDIKSDNLKAGAAKAPRPGALINHKEPILINTHHTQYYGKVLNNNYHYK